MLKKIERADDTPDRGGHIAAVTSRRSHRGVCLLLGPIPSPLSHMVDDDRLEEWPEYFTETCTYRIINRKNHALGRSVGVMECSSRGMLEDRVKALREANVYEPHSYRHLLSGIRIRDQSDSIYRVETSFVVVRTMQEGEMSLFACS